MNYGFFGAAGAVAAGLAGAVAAARGVAGGGVKPYFSTPAARNRGSSGRRRPIVEKILQSRPVDSGGCHAECVDDLHRLRSDECGVLVSNVILVTR